ncbi:DUF418 domain-containing protein [Caldalkalibacillus mannanilyticus]|uniref:DUF418 domain-containing protein n=1 Tax=Caldalkalibacillus mannanilyticus TaxID=1418 RepID=UPI00046AC363|nr:DUF418 domain-containing protein [Caldalkalibacillus mannanilyticus]
MNASIQKDRILSLDIIRGLALLGILFINVSAYIIVIEGAPMPDYNRMDELIEMGITILVEKKFFSIFSFLFGFGFYLFTSNAEKRGDKPRRRFARRLLSLFLLGVVHIIIFWGSILSIYALIGFLLIPFYQAKVSTILKWLSSILVLYITANLLLLSSLHVEGILPFIHAIANDSVLIFIMFLAGFLAAKSGWIMNIEKHKKKVRSLQLIALILFISFSILTLLALQNQNEHLKLIVSLGALPATAFYLLSLFFILENEKWQLRLLPVARVGQMAFTNYVLQSIIGVMFISLMGLETVTMRDVVLITILIYTTQLIYSSIWFKFFRMGPLEKLWRFMTYGRMPQKSGVTLSS